MGNFFGKFFTGWRVRLRSAPPSCRTINVKKEERFFSIPEEDRFAIIEKENRFINIKGCN